jgi:hypothetical protein
MNIRWNSAAILITYCLLLGLLSFLAIRSPKQGTWDILEYIANVEAQHDTDFLHLHNYAYRQLALHTSAANYFDLTQSSEYRRKCANDAVLFGSGLPYYSIRPLYIATIELGTKLGANPVLGASVVAAVSYFVIGLVAFLWMRHHVPIWIAFAASLLLMLSYPLLLIGRLYTPDALAACIMVLATYLIFERGNLLPGLAVLVASVYVRTDAAIYVGFVLLLLAIVKDKRISLRRSHAFVLLVITVASVLAINHFSGNYGFASLMHNQFVNESDPPDFSYSVNLALYLKALASPLGVPAALRGYALLFLLVGFFAAVRVRSTLRDIAIAAILTAFAHFMIFPYFHDRLFAGQYILFAITAVCTLNCPLASIATRTNSTDTTGYPSTVEITSARSVRAVPQ